MRRTLYGKTWLPGALIVLMVSLSACTTGGSTDPLAQRGTSANAMTGASSGTGQVVNESNSVTSPVVSPARQGITDAPNGAADVDNASKPDALQASQAQPAAPSSTPQNGVTKPEAGTTVGNPSTGSSTPPASASGASRTDAQGASSSGSAPAQAASSSALTGTAQPEAPDSSVSSPASASQAGTASSPASSASEPATTVPGAAEAPQSPPAQTAPASGQDAKSAAVSVRIVGDKEKGTILDTVQVELRDGDTVVDVLKRITKEKKVQLETRGSGKSSYIEGIANLYEFDKGAKSGWLYRVNGKFPSVSAGAYTLSKGDRVDWLYTLNLGKDVGKEADK